ncbi:STAS domain-containing protein [Pseudobythopirellula maris]|nr:STAS domain-containing protein [Pseudobythopirellula maris]
MAETQTMCVGDGWWATLEHEGDRLYVRPYPEGDQPTPALGLVERLWAAIDERGVRDVVLEMDDVAFLPSSLMGELVRLHKRLATHSGQLRLSGLHEQCADALHITRLDQVLPTFPGRGAAPG